MRWVAVLALCLAVSAPAWADWGARRDPFDAGVVRRYKAILERNPHDAGALRQLVTMYQRHRTVAKLEAEYEAQLAANDWATLVVLARLPRVSRTETLALWKRALKAKPEDAQGWLAIGDIETEPNAARDAFQRAAQLMTSPRDKRAALTKLIGAARSAGDAAAIDAAYVELIALAPKDGKLWLERGNAQLAAGKAEAARESFTTAEGMLTTDPERRLTAMLNQGVALERLARVDDALAQYERTLDKLPHGYFLGAEIVQRIVDAERKRRQLPAAIARLEKRWPERSRGYIEWALLGDLYKESADEVRALDAYKRAVAKAPTEVVTQRKLIALLDKLRPIEALAQHEAAARVAPGDADIQIELAKRYYPAAKPKALATLDKLARRLNNNVNVRRTIAALYDQWEEPARALGEYEAIANIEPTEEDHAIVLGDAYWRMGNVEKARVAWRRLDKIGTAGAYLRHGEVLANRELWEEALVPYTSSIAADATKPDAWRGRARALQALGATDPQRYKAAADDARRAVALIGTATHIDGERERYLLARVLGHLHTSTGATELSTSVARWRFAFERGDIAAGYMLAAHHARIGSHQQHRMLVDLYKRVPADDSLGLAVARSYTRREDFSRARAELERIRQRSPKRAEDIDKLIAQLEVDRERAEIAARWEEEGRSRNKASGGVGPDIVGRDRRLGIRIELGTDVRNTSSALIGINAYRNYGIAHATAVTTRLGWLQRDDEMEEVNAIAASIGISRRIYDARKFEIAAGIGGRFEVRYGSDAADSSWNRVGLAGDATLELLPRALPASLGVRFQHNFTDDPRGSALVFELGFELR